MEKLDTANSFSFVLCELVAHKDDSVLSRACVQVLGSADIAVVFAKAFSLAFTVSLVGLYI